jgi:hypothetical protein
MIPPSNFEYFRVKKFDTVAICTRMNNVNTSKDKSRLILLHITIGGLITVHKWQILSHTTPGFSARHITPLQWRPPGSTAVEEEGGLGGRPGAAAAPARPAPGPNAALGGQ